MPVLFLSALIGLIMFQKEAVMPLVTDVATSDLFLIDSGDEGSRMAVTTDMTHYAFQQCNIEIRDMIDKDTNISFPNEALQAWGLGNYKYIVNAEIELTEQSGETLTKRYACQIQYEEESNLEGVMDSDNWSIVGISGV